MPHLIDFFIDLGVLLDIGIGGGNISFGLIIVVITDEEFDSILRKELFELAIKLGGQSLIMRDDQRGFLDPLNHIGHGEGLSGTGHTQKDLVLGPFQNILTQYSNGLRLIALGFKFGDEFKAIHTIILQQKRKEGKGFSSEFGVQSSEFKKGEAEKGFTNR
jgi:hypothetical protein